MSKIDRSPGAWDGSFETEVAQNGSDASEDESLWYIFNTLNDPNPRMEDIRDPYGRQAMQELLCSSRECDAKVRECFNVRGLKTLLHPYQSRSAATMVQREVQPMQMLDPRLQAYRSLSGQEYFYDKEEGSIVHEKKMYSEACGGTSSIFFLSFSSLNIVSNAETGILAETMGCGKTLICLAVILATRGHFPRIPTEYQETNNPVRKTAGTLMEMAAASAGRFSIPWRSHFQQMKETGMSFDRCIRVCEQNRGEYLVPPPPSRYQSREGSRSRPPPTRISMSSGTLIIVPPNLVDHWKSEIATHTEGLSVLILRTRDDKTPSEDEILQYDIILFSRTRFEKEAGEPENNRRSPTSQVMESPLKKFHWLRVIVDEGHNVAGHGHKTSAVHMLDQLRVERRWVVSGTPSNGLYGVEVSIASQETLTTDTEFPDSATSSVLRSRKKTGSAVDEELKDLDKLRYIVVEFLKLKPWSNSRAHDPANWSKYIKPLGEDGKRRKAPSLRAVLQSLVVRHRLNVINSELPLPRLHNKVVSLEPTFYDKLSINIFLFNLTVNAITSERKDQDYMFQSRNRKHLSLTINNLRQAGFWWTGFDRKDLEKTVDVAEKYLEKNIENMVTEDRHLLSEGLHIAQKALSCKSFQAFCNFDELGVYIKNFPEHARGLWALTSQEDETVPLLLGISQARSAQKFVTAHLIAEDPAEGLAGAGIMARRQLSERAEKKPAKNNNEAGAADNLTHKHKPEKTEQKSPKKTFSQGLMKRLPVESPLSRAMLVATTSVKLTYLLDRVQALHKTEKIIIFYENNNSAFWIAEGLEMLGIDFRIYANTLKTSQKAAYLSLFEESETVRILLMDLRQASHGLHIASASRVFIVNPIWRPNVESQAIKRAHRIGQTKPVFVETLVLKDTLEEKMLRRRQQMSNAELQHAEKDMLEDSTMSSIIQHERFYPLADDEELMKPAYLHDPCGFFDRHELPLPDNYYEDLQPSTHQGLLTPSKRKQQVPSFDIPWVDSDVSPAGSCSPKKRKVALKAPKFQIVTESGIVMTPPKSSPSRAPKKQVSLTPPISPTVTRDGNATLSLFGGR
jgi:SNF2 family DNA or RNA helicase